MDLCRTVPKIDGDFHWKSQNVPTPLYFALQLKGFPCELGIGAWVNKLEWWGYRAVKKFDDIFIRLDTMHQRDGRTDGRTDTGRQQGPRLRIASRGKAWVASARVCYFTNFSLANNKPILYSTFEYLAQP